MGSFDPVFYNEEVHILTSTTATQFPLTNRPIRCIYSTQLTNQMHLFYPINQSSVLGLSGNGGGSRI
jgi:hypothetical protein